MVLLSLAWIFRTTSVFTCRWVLAAGLAMTVVVVADAIFVLVRPGVNVVAVWSAQPACTSISVGPFVVTRIRSPTLVSNMSEPY